MNKTQNNITNVLLWLTPTVTEIAIYLFITFFTVVLSSQDFVNNLLFATGDFNPIREGIGSIDRLLERIVGEKVAGSLSLGIFWGLVGLIVNLLWWLGSNFSTELNNDLVFSKYVHPKDADPKSHLREFVEKAIIRTIVAVIGIVYINFVLSQWLPRITQRYNDVLNDFSIAKDWKLLIITIGAQVLMLHIFVVLTRIILLRKQVFDR